MKKIILNALVHCFILLVAVIIYGCEGCGKGTQGGVNPLGEDNSRTTINYQINLAETHKSKEEDNKVYYEVPLNTATVVGPQMVTVHWEQMPNNILGVQLNTTRGQGFRQEFNHTKHIKNNKVASEHSATKTEFSWMLASDHPLSITVFGRPHYTGQAQEIKDKIINNNKVFAINWK